MMSYLPFTCSESPIYWGDLGEIKPLVNRGFVYLSLKRGKDNDRSKFRFAVKKVR